MSDIELFATSGDVVCVDNSIGSRREYRSALISAAVTGKIDVREVQM